MIIIHLSWGF